MVNEGGSETYRAVRSAEREVIMWELTLAEIRALPETFDCPTEEKI